ncbi:hypothetical protein E8P82_12325 [Arthrobacter echini]|uniref:Integral membrane protein n=1 Tax=Arthrobacter echini TaxID=1529066 RepID=A0A4S5E2A1_9MICC|nr:hypothetical protein [Arthrobacter echini]THJ65521.1 hypothetical protein E8P82_12325 [Arthrobacter echini]
MRTLVSALLALLALVAAAGGLAAAWIDENLVDESGFVALAAPLAEDAEFQAALTDSLVEEATTTTGLPERITSFVEPLIRNAVTALTDTAGYPAAWDRTLRVSHALTFAQAPEPGEPAPAIITLDLAPVIGLVTDRLGDGLGVEVPVPEDTTIEVGSLERGGMLSWASDAVIAWPVYLTIAGVLAVLAVVVARRRGTTLALLGLGVAGIGVLGVLAGRLLPERLGGAPGMSAVADVFVQGVAARAGTDIAGSSVAVLVAGLMAMAVGIAVRLTFGRRRRRFR